MAAPISATQLPPAPIPKEASLYMDDLRHIIKRGKLVVAIPKFNLPLLFASDNNGDLHGYYIDLAKNIAQKLGVKLEFDRTANSFNEIVDLIAQNKADVAICHLSKTIDRAKKTLYTNNDVTLYQTLMINRVWLAKHVKTDNVNDAITFLKNNSCAIGVISKSSYLEFAKNIFPLATLKEYASENLYDALSSGEVNVIFYDDFYMREKLLNRPNIVLKFRAIILKNRPDLIAMAVPPKRWEWMQWLNSYLEIENIKTDTNKLLQRTAGVKSRLGT